MATTQEDLLRQIGVTLPDGRRFQRGAITSAADAARTDATRATNATRDAELTARVLGTPAPRTPVIPDSAVATLGAPRGGLGDSPVAKAVAAALPSLGVQPGATPQAPIMGGGVDVNSYSGSRYATDPLPLPGTPGAAQAGYGGTRSDPGINVNGYTGSRYAPDFAANNPAPQLDAPEIAMAKQMLAMNSGRVPGRFYDAGNLARATPQQIQIEAALLPSRQAQATADTESAAILEGIKGLQRGGAAYAPSAADVTAALGREPGSAPPSNGQLSAPPDIAAAVTAYVKRGGRDPKRIQEIRETGESIAKTTPAAPKPLPGSAGYQTITLPGGGTIVRDTVTGLPVSSGDIILPKDKKTDEKSLTATEIQQLNALQQAARDVDILEERFKSFDDPNWGGPVAGRLNRLTSVGTNPRISEIDNLVTAATPNLARGVFREVGVLTDADVTRYKALLPAVNDTAEQRANKLRDLRARISSTLDETLNTFNAAGRDVGGIRDQVSTGRAGPAAPASITPADAAAELARRRAAKK